MLKTRYVKVSRNIPKNIQIASSKMSNVVCYGTAL